MHINLSVLLLLLMVFVAACQGDDPAPTNTPVPPTPVPEQPIEEATSTEIPTQRPLVRETLPPTWTQTPTNTPLPPTPTDTPAPTIEIASPPEACNDFGPNIENSSEEVTLGEDATIAWFTIAESPLYWVVVTNESGFQVFERYVEEGELRIPADVFATATRYGWEVRPLNDVGEQFCRGTGGLINVRPN